MGNKYQHIMEKLGGRYGYSSSGPGEKPRSEDELKNAEQHVGFSLPLDYVEFVRDYGGYVFSEMIFKVAPNPDWRSGGLLDTFYSVDTFAWMRTVGLESMKASGETYPVDLVPGIALVKNLEEGVEEFEWPEELLPIGCDPAGNQICLAVSGLRPGAVFFWINAANYGEQNLYLIADSFDEFMNGLQFRRGMI